MLKRVITGATCANAIRSILKAADADKPGEGWRLASEIAIALGQPDATRAASTLGVMFSRQELYRRKRNGVGRFEYRRRTRQRLSRDEEAEQASASSPPPLLSAFRARLVELRLEVRAVERMIEDEERRRVSVSNG